MMCKLKLAAVACALGVSGSPNDMTELVQSNLKIHGAPKEEAVSLAKNKVSGTGGMDSRFLASVFTKQALAQMTLGFIVKNGHRWSTFLWGNATAGVSGQQVPDTETAGCSAGDRQTATTKLQKLQDDFASTMAEMLPKVMAEMQGGGGVAAAHGGKLPLATPFGNGEPSIDMGDLDALTAKVPAACKELLSPQGSLQWASIMGCATEVLGVSTDCLNCFPQFGKQLQDGCNVQCDSALNEAATGLDNSLAAVQTKVMKIKRSAFGGMASQQDTMEIKQLVHDAMKSGLKKLVPCGECVAPKATSFARCMGGEEAATFVRKLSDQLNSDMKRGELMEKAQEMSQERSQQRSIM